MKQEVGRATRDRDGSLNQLCSNEWERLRELDPCPFSVLDFEPEGARTCFLARKSVLGH